MADDRSSDKRVDVTLKRGMAVALGMDVSAAIFRRLPPEHPVHSLVGRVATEWAYFEHLLDRIIWQLAKVDERTGACLTGQMMGSHARLTAIQALCRDQRLPETIIKQVAALSSRCKGVQDRRNRILHDSWYFETETEEAHQFKAMARDEYKFGFHAITEDFVCETLTKMGRRIESAKQLRADVSATLRHSAENR